jgi:hypothetical protein
MGTWQLLEDEKCPMCGDKVEGYIVTDDREGDGESHDYVDSERCINGCY